MKTLLRSTLLNSMINKLMTLSLLLLTAMAVLSFPETVISASTQETAAFAAPLNITATSVFNSIVLTWEAPVDADASLVNYQVEYRKTSINTWTIASSSIPHTASSYAIEGLDPFTKYFVRITAKTENAIGTYGYPWSKIYQVISPIRSGGFIQYEPGYGRVASDAYSNYTDTDFSRVRYLMSVDINGVRNYMDADFNKQISSIGSGQFNEFTLDNLRVPSTDPSQRFVVKGNVTDLSVFGSGSLAFFPINKNNLTGRIEHWPYNYSGTSQSSNDFSDSSYDHNDSPAMEASYGSFQLHELGTSRPTTQTLFAWNRHAASPEIGFGNQPTGHRDWTFCSTNCSGRDTSTFSLGIFINAAIETGEPSNTIEFFPNGGTGLMNNQYVLDGEEIELSSGAFTKLGYSFSHWNSQADGNGTTYSNQERVTVSGVLSLYAQWNIITYNVDFELNGGQTPESLPSTYTILTDFSIYQPVLEHRLFEGWYLVGDFSQPAITSGVTEDRTLFANYNDVSYAISYQLGSGTLADPLTSYTISTPSVTLAPVTPPTGYQFIGWEDENKQVVTGFDPSISPANRTFIAVYQAITHSITYQMNWGTNAISNPSTFTIEDTIVFASGTKTGYEFAGFYTNAAFNGSVFTGIPAGTNAPMTLYAKWTPTNLPGRFQLNWELFRDTSSQWNGKLYPTIGSDFDLGFSNMTPVATGSSMIESYDNAEAVSVGPGLLKWLNASQLESVIGPFNPTISNHFAVRLTGYFIPSQSGLYTFSVTGDDATDLTLSGPGIEGQWTIGRYGGNGTGTLGEPRGTGSIALQAGAVYEIRIRQQEHEGGEGLKFGWRHPGQTTNYSVYAYELFATTPSIITYEANGANGSMAPQSVVVGQQIPLSANDFIKEGHVFAGWNTLANGLGDAYENFITPPGDMTLYAQWRLGTYTFTFDVAGGSGVTAISQLFNSTITTPETPIRNGYLFEGWVPALPTTMPGADATFTAQWSAKTYNIMFDARNGIASESSSTVVFQSGFGPLPSAERTGYTFDGWFSEVFGGTPITNSTVVSIPSDVTIYAQWTPVNYTISFDAGGGSLIANQTLTIESAPLVLPQPSKLASVFIGWTTQSNRQGSGITEIPTGITADLTLYAMWEAQSFYANESINLTVPTALYESMGSAAGLTFTATGMPSGVQFDPSNRTFTGAPTPRSGLDDETFTIGLTIAGNGMSQQYEIVMNVLYNARLLFITNGGDDIATIDVPLAMALTAPTPARTGYQFLEWHETEELDRPFNWSSGVAQSQTTLYAKWTPTIYSITIVEGGSRVTYPETYTIESPDITLPIPSQGGLIFQSWSDEGRIPSGSTGNRTFVASWNPRSYTLTILADGRQVSRSTIAFGSSLASVNLGTPPAKEGHTGVGWDRTLPSTMPAENITVTALYSVQSYPFIALDDEGNELASANVDFKAGVPYPSPPEKEGFTFVRWEPNTASMPASNLTVRAVYEVAEFDVTFVDSEGNDLGSAKVAFGAPVTAIEPPDLEGKVFVEWTGLPESMPAEAVTVTAVYEDADVEDEDEENEENEENEDEDVVEELDEDIPKLPTRRNITPIFIPEVILPPNPEPVVTRVSVNGVDMDVSIIPGQPVGVLPAATLTGYNFQGWMNAITGEMITPETVINNPDFVVLVPLFEKAPTLLDAAKNVFQAIVVNPFTKPVPANDLTTRTDNIQSSRVTPNEPLESFSIPGGLNLEVRADGRVVIPLPNEKTPLEISVRGLDPSSAQVYYLLGTEVPEHQDEKWQPYSGQPFLTNKPNQNVFLMVKDAFETNQVTFLRPATFVTNADKIPVNSFIQVSSNATLDSLENTKQHTFLTQVEYEDTVVDMFVIEPRIDNELVDMVVRYRANNHNKSILLNVEAVVWYEGIILPGTSLGVYLRSGDNLDFSIEYRFHGRESVLESFQVTNSPTGVGILLPVQPNNVLRVVLALLVVATMTVPYFIKPKE